jgi:hypothetical protein
VRRPKDDPLERAIASPGAIEAGIGRRPYQIAAARQIVKAAARGRSAEVQLPTGTGKTLIANLTAILWRHHRPHGKVLLIAPRRALALQHNRYSGWSRAFLDVLIVTDHEAARPVQLSPWSKRADMLIGLPGLLSGCIGRLAIPASVVKSIDLIIVDEFDEFLHQEYTRESISVRFDRDFEELRVVLPKSVPVVLMSGTSPSAARGSEAERLSAFIQRVYKPLAVKIAEKDYAKFIPKVRLRVLLINDPAVIRLDEAVGTDLMYAMNALGEALRAYADTRWLYPRLPLILGRRIRVIRLEDGRTVRATPDAVAACARIQSAVNRALFLQEDMLAGYEAEVEEFFLQPWDSDEWMKLTRPRFTRRPEEAEYYPAPHDKFATVLRLATERTPRLGVVFVRNIRLAHAIRDAATQLNLKPAVLHGELTPAAQDAAVQALGTSANILVMVRETGKRGLDLPQADYAIFFSARSSEVASWQEFSRIRSTVSATKDIYLLAYLKTREIERLSGLLDDIRASGREYEISEQAI